LKQFCNLHGFNVCRQISLESIRRSFCDVNSVSSFFEQFSNFFKIDSRLIINFDETSLSSQKKFKVLSKSGKLPVACIDIKPPHITGIITISAAGRSFRPFIILQKKKRLQNLEQYVDASDFGTSSSGWITRGLFLSWAYCFVAEMARYRLILPIHLQQANLIGLRWPSVKIGF
jgi:hypothetical protein